MQRIVLFLLAVVVALAVLAPARAVAQPADGQPGQPIQLHVQPSDGPAHVNTSATVRSPHSDRVESHGKGMALLFWAFAAASIGGALFVISRRNLIAAVMGMVGSFLGIAAVYMMLYAHFLAVIQMLVYAGAIMVLFVFVIMILNRPEDEPVAPTGHIGQLVGGLAILYLVGRLVMLLAHVSPPGDPAKVADALALRGKAEQQLVEAQTAADNATAYLANPAHTTLVDPQGVAANQAALANAQAVIDGAPDRIESADLRYRTASAQTAPPPVQLPGGGEAEWGSVKAVGSDLFSGGLFPFEAISILLLIAVVGAIAIAKPLKDDDGEESDGNPSVGEDLAAAAAGEPRTTGGHA